MARTCSILILFFSLLLSLDQVASKVQVQEGEEYQTVTSELAMAVVEVKQRSKSIMGWNYFVKCHVLNYP